MIKYIISKSIFLLSIFLNIPLFNFFLPKITVLYTHQYVLTLLSRYNVVSDDHLGVLLGPHTKVHELGVALVQLL